MTAIGLLTVQLCTCCRQHRQFLREHLGAGGSSTQVLKIMALLVESGMIYCLVWVRMYTAPSSFEARGYSTPVTDCVMVQVEFLVYHLLSDMMPGINVNGGRWRAASFYHEACVAPIVVRPPLLPSLPSHFVSESRYT